MGRLPVLAHGAVFVDIADVGDIDGRLLLAVVLDHILAQPSQRRIGHDAVELSPHVI